MKLVPEHVKGLEEANPNFGVSAWLNKGFFPLCSMALLTLVEDQYHNGKWLTAPSKSP